MWEGELELTGGWGSVNWSWQEAGEVMEGELELAGGWGSEGGVKWSWQEAGK